jgi:hypothetical protein
MGRVVNGSWSEVNVLREGAVLASSLSMIPGKVATMLIIGSANSEAIDMLVGTETSMFAVTMHSDSGSASVRMLLSGIQCMKLVAAVSSTLSAVCISQDKQRLMGIGSAPAYEVSVLLSGNKLGDAGFADVDGDGECEVVYVSDDGIHVIFDVGTATSRQETVRGGIVRGTALSVDSGSGVLIVVNETMWSLLSLDSTSRRLQSGSVRMTAVASGLSKNWSAVKIGDVDCDGLFDVVYGGREGDVGWLQNVGSNVFVERRLRALNTQPVRHVDVVDVDRDGDNDVIVSGKDGLGLTGSIVYRNPSHPSLSVSVAPTRTSGSVFVVSVTELSRMTTLSDAVVSVWCRNSQLSVLWHETVRSNGVYTFEVSVGESDDEKWKWEVLSVNVSLASVTGARLLSGVIVKPGTPWSVSSGVDAVGVAHAVSVSYDDVNKDGLLDASLVTATGSLSVWRGSINGSFVDASSSYRVSGVLFEAVTCGDVNGDGMIDVVGIGGGKLVVFTGAGYSPVISDVPVSHMVGVHMFDVNADGWLDTTIVGNDSVGVALGSGSGMGLIWQHVTDVSDGICHSEVSDINSDGWPDIVMFGCTGHVKCLFRHGNSSDWWYEASVLFVLHVPVGEVPSGACGDWNNDGFMDVFVSSSEGLVVMQNDGLGAFVDVWRSGSGVLNGSLAVGDVDLDGNTDVLIGWKNGMKMLVGSEKGLVDVSDAWDIGRGCEGAISLVDIDGDGDLDIPCTSARNPRVSETSPQSLTVNVLRRDGTPTMHGCLVHVCGGENVCRTEAVAGSPYGVSFAVARAADVLNVSVTLLGGIQLNPAMFPLLTNVVVSQLPFRTLAVVVSPFIDSVVIVPHGDCVGLGGVVVVNLRAGGNESGLRAVQGNCWLFKFGVDVCDSFVELGGGMYAFTMRVENGLIGRVYDGDAPARHKALQNTRCDRVNVEVIFATHD